MKITGIHSHKDGLNFIKKNRPKELKDVYDAVENIDFISALSKLSYEDTRQNPLFSPPNINSQLANYLLSKDWLERSDDLRSAMTEEVYRNYQRNKKLIDLSEIPEDIQQDVINNYDNQKPAMKMKVLNYLIKKRCNNLIEVVEEFYNG